MKRTLLSTAIALATLATGVAHAGGSVSLTVNPRNAQEAQALRVGLGLYALHKQVESDAHVSQQGNGNAAAIGQSGQGHRGIIEQDGDGHEATLDQSGRGHSCGIFQFGEGTRANVRQRGRGESCLVLQAGWD
jgi:minor curlin subunit